MRTARYETNFIETQAGMMLKVKLEHMQASDLYITKSSYTPNTDKYEDNLIPFVDKHMNYILAHPQLDPEMYISNLKILTRVKRV